MEKAIVTGANGYIGSAVVRKLLSEGVEVLALGRKKWGQINPKRLKKSKNLRYLTINFSEISLLYEKLNHINWVPGPSCVFYNFLWSGDGRLTDGTYEDQFNNVTLAAKFVEEAKNLGCVKFINAGSQEEKYVKDYLKYEWTSKNYHSSMATYAVAKLASRNMCQLIAYLNKIIYVHTRISGVIDKDLSAEGYIASTMRKIMNGEKYDYPENPKIIDLTPIDEVAKAYYLIGQRGKNKGDYFIGTGDPKTLAQYFLQFKLTIENEKNAIESTLSHEKDISFKHFSIEHLNRDTSFKPDVTFLEFAKSLVS